jgi:molybdate transport system substrate-binding protein
LGVVVRPGAPVPDISNADAIKRAVVDAESVVFNRASSGLYFEGLLKKMGVFEQIESKTARYITGAEVMEHVLKGKGREVGFGPITEILQYKDKGLRLVGPLPAEIQNYTVYAVGVGTAAKDPEAAKAFIKTLTGSSAAAVLKSRGMEGA